MYISPYSIPAILALLAKAGILYFSRRAVVQPIQARMFRAAVALSMFLNVAELAVLQKISTHIDYWGGVVYYAASTMLLPLLVHLAISISFDNWNTRRFLRVYILMYGSALVIAVIFVFFTPLFMTGARGLGGYTATAIQGPFYWVYRIFLLSSLICLLLIPILGLRSTRPENKRSQCKLWILAVSPLVLLIGTITYLLQARIFWFNATVTAPLLIAFFLGTIGYIIHNTRVIELSFYIPWSSARRAKGGLYQRLNELGGQLGQVSSAQELLIRVANILACPVTLVLSDKQTLTGTDITRNTRVPSRDELRQFTRLVVISETRDIPAPLRDIMLRHTIDAVVPFFPYSSTSPCWILFGAPFSRCIFSALDFKVLQELFEKLSGLLIDQLIQLDHAASKPPGSDKDKPVSRHLARWRHETINDPAHLPRPLEECIAEFEATCIKAALERSKGNKAEAARSLGLKPNTFHYKLRRYGLS